jgi:hypothetical protein
MSDNKDSNNTKVTIVLAVIGVVGTAITALFANWDKIFATSPSNPPPSVSTTNSPPENPLMQGTIYIQISSERQRNDAEALRRKLGDAGFFVPDIEVVGSRAHRDAQVRYFYQDDFETAKRIKEIASQSSISGALLMSLTHVSEKNPPGFLEIWYPLQE